MSIYRTIDVDSSITPIINLDAMLTSDFDATADITTEINRGSGSGGTRDYNALIHKPQINSVELIGNKELTDIGIGTLSNSDLENLLQ